MKAIAITERVELEFPNPRLFLYVLLANSQSTSSEAIVEAALEFGLIDSQTAQQLRLEEQSEPCQCMASVKQVLKYYCARQNERSDAPHTSANEVYASLDSLVHKFCQSPGTSKYSAPSDANHNCARFAPIVFDLLLQEIRRYP